VVQYRENQETPVATIEKYKMSFTTGGLLRKETVTMASLFLASQNWMEIRRLAIEENCLQMKALSSRKRIFMEIKFRLKCLSLPEMQILCSGQLQDIDVLLWLALCRCYHFIGDFAKEILHEKFISIQPRIDLADYNLFVEQKSILHPEIPALTDATRARLRQMLFLFMRNCRLIDRDNRILPAFFSPAVAELFKNAKQAEIAFFPITPKRIEK